MADFDPFAGGEILRVSPTTGPQKEIIASAKMSDEANTAFNEAILLWMDGNIDHELLRLSLQKLIGRHDILRAGFSRNGKDICLYEESPFDLEIQDLSALDRALQEQAIAQIKIDAAITPLNLEEGPLLYARLLTLSESRHALILVAHHLVCDGWSFGILLEELSAIYRNNGSDSEFQEAPSFLDFAEEQEAGQIANRDVDFWHDKFSDIPTALDLPLDRKRPATRAFAAARIDYELNEGLVEAARKRAAESEASQMNLLLAVYFLLLHRLTSSNDIVVGIPIAGQASFSRTGQVGHLVQLLPIRIEMTPKMQFGELVERVKSAVLDAAEHPNFTFGKLLETLVIDRTRVPLISTLFNIDQEMKELNFGSLRAEVESVPRSAENFELFLNLLPSSDRIGIEATYSTALFSEGTIRSWLRAFETLLEEAALNPEKTLEEFPLTRELPDVVSRANSKTLQLENSNFIEAFQKQVNRTPLADAIVSQGTTTNYADLDAYSDILRDRLIENGVGSGDLVGICLQRSTAMVASVLAVLKTGAGYLPLDPDFPESRLLYMIEDSKLSALFADSSTSEGIRKLGLVQLDPLLNGSLDRHASAEPDKNVPVESFQPAYRIYTSGSTGTPKGVTISHRSLINFLEVMAAEPGCSSDDRLLAVTTLSFDISVLELFLPLIVGGVTIIATTDESKDGSKIAALIEQFKPTILQATPSTWKLLLSSSWGLESPPLTNKLKAFCGGEPLSSHLADRILPRVSELWNLYGPTEATVWTSVKRIEAQRPGISIGLPIANTQTLILDANLNPLPISVAGELYLGGVGIAIGYHGLEELNAEKFILHPKYGRLYRTGDIAKYWPNGEIEHLGRLDDQVKIRGYRVELGEIESALTEAEGIADAAVYLWKLSDDDVRIVACCTPSSDKSLAIVAIRKALRTTLPAYMVPQYILQIDSIPYLPNGKVDNASLPRPEVTASTLLNRQALNTQLEKDIAAIWMELISTSTELSKDDNFFQIGGHSLLALEAIRRIELLTGARITAADIVSKTLAAIAAELAEANVEEAQDVSGPEALPLSAERPLTQEQERILQRQLESPQNLLHNLPAAWVMTGDLDEDLFLKSLERVFERQTALRTILSSEHGEYRQSLYRFRESDVFETLDYSDQSDAEALALQSATELADKPFEVLDKPLVRVRLYRISSNRHLLFLLPHQLIFDGWSFDIFINELTSTYSALLDNKATHSDPLPFEFRDYCAWSRQRPVNERTRSFHRKNSMETGKKAQHPEPMRTKVGQSCASFTALELQELESRCNAHGLRLHEFLYSAFFQSLGSLLSQKRLVVGVALSGRLAPEVVGLIGSFVSTLPCPIELRGDDFLSRSRHIAEQLETFQAHQDLSFAELYSAGNDDEQIIAPAVQASIAFQDARQRNTELAGLKLSQVDFARKQIQHPIEFWTRIEADGFEINIDYDAAEIEAKDIELLLEKMRVFIGEDQRGATPQRLADHVTTEESSSTKKGWRNLFR